MPYLSRTKYDQNKGHGCHYIWTDHNKYGLSDLILDAVFWEHW